MGSPAQLTKNQVSELKAAASGATLEEKQIRVGKDGEFSLTLPIRQNDVFLIEVHLVK